MNEEAVATVVKLIEAADIRALVRYGNQHPEQKPQIVAMLMAGAPELLATMILAGLILIDNLAVAEDGDFMAAVPDPQADPQLN